VYDTQIMERFNASSYLFISESSLLSRYFGAWSSSSQLDSTDL